MFTRRIFMQGTAAILGGLLPALSAARAQAAANQPVIAIDSVETPFFAAGPGQRHLRLSGSQLDRFNQLREVLGAPGALRIDAHRDGTAEVLLETALNTAGRSVTGRGMQDGVTRLTVRSI